MFGAAVRSESMEKSVDWAVFALGAIALSTAIIATALPSVDGRLAEAETVTVVAPTS